LVDEQAFAAPFATALNSMYFDEIYHGRTAYEHIHALEPYEWTHPPLGKLIISLGIRAFGMNPFGWRIMGMLAGVLLVPLLYALARQAMPRGPWALGCAAAFAFDFMRYTQTRIGTVDVYVVLFVLAAYASMYRFYLSCLDGSARPAAWALALSGLSFSLGAATKWNAVYAGLGLAFLFFIAYFKYALRDRKASVLPKVGVFLLCFASFIILPLAVYAASYIPLLAVPGKTWKSVLDWQGQMLRYHAGLKASHDFASPWWQWPLMIKPVWYFKGDGLAPGMTSTIAAMGNPLIYWFSFAGAAGALYLAYARRDIRVLPLLAGYFSQYLPWALVPRLTFLYHYFPIAPFGLVCIIYCLRPLSLPGPKNPEATAFLREHWIWLYAGACAALFILFFPAISGLPVPSIWIRLLRWSPSWYF
jgi:dolichyl-phosphate-mannose--protein O-mannosyl transferase